MTTSTKISVHYEEPSTLDSSHRFTMVSHPSGRKIEFVYQKNLQIVLMADNDIQDFGNFSDYHLEQKVYSYWRWKTPHTQNHVIEKAWKKLQSMFRNVRDAQAQALEFPPFKLPPGCWAILRPGSMWGTLLIHHKNQCWLKFFDGKKKYTIDFSSNYASLNIEGQAGSKKLNNSSSHQFVSSMEEAGASFSRNELNELWGKILLWWHKLKLMEQSGNIQHEPEYSYFVDNDLYRQITISFTNGVLTMSSSSLVLDMEFTGSEIAYDTLYTWWEQHVSKENRTKEKLEYLTRETLRLSSDGEPTMETSTTINTLTNKVTGSATAASLTAGIDQAASLAAFETLVQRVNNILGEQIPIMELLNNQTQTALTLLVLVELTAPDREYLGFTGINQEWLHARAKAAQTQSFALFFGTMLKPLKKAFADFAEQK